MQINIKVLSGKSDASTGFPNLGVGRLQKGGRQGKCKNKIIFLFNMGRENHHKIPLIISQISK